jgi:hypothetical protein
VLVALHCSHCGPGGQVGQLQAKIKDVKRQLGELHTLKKVRPGFHICAATLGPPAHLRVVAG